MRKSRFNESQRQAILDSYLKGSKTVEALCEEHQISPATFYKWKNEVETEKHEDKKRLKALYMQAKLSLHRNPKKPRLKRVFQKLLPPDQINEGWAMDFLSEWVIGEKQQSVRIINVVDECSRKDLWVEAAHNINAGKLIEVLDKIVEMRGLPRYIRCDNGPEFISAKLKEWASDKVEIKFIQPGKPTQNGIIERLNGTVRKECLNLNWFHSLDEVNDLLGNWYKTYNFDRPHSSLKYKTPVTFENLNQNLYFKMAPATGG